MSLLGKSFSKCASNRMYPSRNLFQPLRPVITGIHRSDVGEQCLRCADVAGGFLAADVLLAGLQREAQGRFAARIFGDSHNAAGHVALESIPRGEERGMWAAIAKRHTKALRAANGNVRAKFTGRLNQRESEQLCRNGDHWTGGMGLFNKA